MRTKLAGIVLMAVGVAAIVASTAADVLRIGTAPGFGAKQGIGAGAGLVLLGLGGWLSQHSPADAD